MADTSSTRTALDVGAPSTTGLLVVYLLLGFAALTQILGTGFAAPAPLFTLIGIVAVVVAYVRRDDVRGTWQASHMSMAIRTFWWSTLWAIAGWLLFVTILGIPFALGIWAAVSIWVLYRVIRGVLLFKDQRPYPGF